MNYEMIIAEIVKAGGKVETVYCDHCNQSNYVIREQCRCCGACLGDEKDRLRAEIGDFEEYESYWLDGGNPTGYPEPSPYSVWNSDGPGGW